MLRFLRGALALLLTAIVSFIPAAQAQVAGKPQMVALVIGNSAYLESPLPNPVNDARSIAAMLGKLGFEVIKRENLKAREIGPTLREFKAKIKPGAEALFFYAGHGLQIKGVNYLPAVDAEISGEEDVPTQSMNVNMVLELLGESRTRINMVFLDACRNNPFTNRFRNSGSGLAKVEAPSGTLVSFATRPGSTASDGTGDNGLYTEHLLKNMQVPGLTIEQVLKRVVAGVKADSKGAQEPFMEGSIEGDFYFVGVAGGGATAVLASPSASPEETLWLSVERGRTIPEYNAYLAKFPNGTYAELAKARIKTLEAEAEESRKQEAQRDMDAWKVAEAAGTVAAMQGYLRSFPSGKFSPQVRDRLDKEKAAEQARQADASAWAEAEKVRSIEAYQAYQKNFPAGAGIGLVAERIKVLQQEAAERERQREIAAWEAAEKSQKEEDYQSYMKQWPTGRFSPLVPDRLQKIAERKAEEERKREAAAFAAASGEKTIAAVEKFLKDFPAGANASAARTLLEDLQRQERRRPGRVFRECDVCPEMIVLPTGQFEMGASDAEKSFFSSAESPRHKVSIAQPLAMGRHEVTFAEWDACVAAGGCKHQPADGGWGRGKQPVTQVNWNDAQDYLRWLSAKTGVVYRLPSEAEWEYAARAGSATIRPWGEEIGKNNANCDGCGSAFDDKKLAPVGSFAPNAFGLFDMLGNALEWVEDCFVSGYEEAPVDGAPRYAKGACSKRAQRGGGVFISYKDTRSAARFSEAADTRKPGFGFRVARPVD